jgi:transposase-like protein
LGFFMALTSAELIKRGKKILAEQLETGATIGSLCAKHKVPRSSFSTVYRKGKLGEEGSKSRLQVYREIRAEIQSSGESGNSVCEKYGIPSASYFGAVRRGFLDRSHKAKPGPKPGTVRKPFNQDLIEQATIVLPEPKPVVEVEVEVEEKIAVVVLKGNPRDIRETLKGLL